MATNNYTINNLKFNNVMVYFNFFQDDFLNSFVCEKKGIVNNTSVEYTSVEAMFYSLPHDVQDELINIIRSWKDRHVVSIYTNCRIESVENYIKAKYNLTDETIEQLHLIVGYDDYCKDMYLSENGLSRSCLD